MAARDAEGREGWLGDTESGYAGNASGKPLQSLVSGSTVEV